MRGFYRTAPSGVRGSVVTEALVALRRGREAVTDVDGQLDTILDWLQDPSVPLDAETPDRLARSLRDADEALGPMSPLREVASHAIF